MARAQVLQPSSADVPGASAGAAPEAEAAAWTWTSAHRRCQHSKQWLNQLQHNVSFAQSSGSIWNILTPVWRWRRNSTRSQLVCGPVSSRLTYFSAEIDAKILRGCLWDFVPRAQRWQNPCQSSRGDLGRCHGSSGKQGDALQDHPLYKAKSQSWTSVPSFDNCDSG